MDPSGDLKNRLTPLLRTMVISVVMIGSIITVLVINARPPTTPLLELLRAKAVSKTSIHRYIPSVKQTVEGETLLVPDESSEIERIVDGFCHSPEWTKLGDASMLSYNTKEPNRIDFIVISYNSDKDRLQSEKLRINIQYRRTAVDKAIDWLHSHLLPGR